MMFADIKIRVNHLILIAGVSASGKSTLIAKLKTSSLNQNLTDEILGEIDPADVPVLSAFELDQTPLTELDTLILHYDMHSSYKPDEGFTYLSKLFGESKNIKAITMCAPSEILRARVKRRLKSVLWETFIKPSWAKLKWVKYIYSKYRFYKNTDDLKAFYDLWYDFLATKEVSNHFLINSNSTLESYPEYFSRTLVNEILSSKI